MSSPVPYEIVEGGLQVVGGSSACFELGFPGKAYLHKILVTQSAGVSVDFTVQVYNREVICDGSASDFDDEGDTLPDSIFKVVPDISGTSGVAAQYFSPPAVFYNQDPVGAIGKVRKMYVKIFPSGSGEKTFAIAVAGSSYM